MDSIELEPNGSCIDDLSIEQFDSSDTYNIFGEPDILPRIGNEYQVEIPPLIGEVDCILYKSNPAEVENGPGVPFNLLMGLPIPLFWINQEVGKVKHETAEWRGETAELHGDSESSSFRYGSFEPASVKGTTLEKENSDIKSEPSDIPTDNGAIFTGSVNPAVQEEEQQCTFPGCHLVPGSDVDSWNNNEKGCFLLGLYIFEKNFVQVKRFVESKRMGDVLAFYYGKFYGSPEYKRWSECRKMKSKRSVYGQKLFTGLRQQELLSRLLPSVSEECQNALSEVSKTFDEGKMLLEDYVFSLKAMVGTNVLVEAIGIGKGKRDLTCMAVEPSRANQVIPLRSEIPTGKACAALEPREIIKFLTGDYRLSKARASDLFWEAVWPRLLARGWQSEQPKNEGKDSLVFLVPGIKRFSRRKLVKGKQYFDSLTDVLTKVASEPTLLELTSEVGEGNKRNEDDELTPERKENQDVTPTRTRPCYLQPRTPNRSTSAMKFTVVDTSLPGGKPYKVRELRSLPLETSNKLISASHSERSGESTSEVSSDESDTGDDMVIDQGKTDDTISRLPNGKLPDKEDRDIVNLKREISAVCPDSTNGPVSSSSNIRNLNDKQSRRSLKSGLSQRLKTENVDIIAPVTKRRRRLTACSHQEDSNVTSNSSVVPISEPEVPTSYLGDNDVLSQIASSQDKLSSTISSKGCQSESIECARSNDCRVVEDLQKGPQTRTLIDLNVLPAPSDFESGVFMTESVEEHEDHSNQKAEDHNAMRTSADMETSGLRHETVTRRQSTRNRPPTARALEALANGFLTVSNRPRKNKETSSVENLTSRTSRRPRGGAGAADLSASSMESRIDEGGSGVFNGGRGDMFSDPRVVSEENRPPTAGPQFD